MGPKFRRFTTIVAVSAALSSPGAVLAEPEAGNLGTGGDSGNQIAAGVWASADGSTVTYEALFFEPYQAVTAADMLRWVPGGAALLPQQRRGGNQPVKRGFGSGGDQILINGKRISGKSNDIASAIQRIQADVVSRIEVIRGTSAARARSSISCWRRKSRAERAPGNCTRAFMAAMQSTMGLFRIAIQSAGSITGSAPS